MTEKNVSFKPRLLLAGSGAKAVDSIRAALVQEGYQVEGTFAADEVIRLARLNPYAAIILDVTTPSGSGLTW